MRLLEKILDRYYTDKFIQSLKTEIITRFTVNYKAVKKDDMVEIYLKPWRFKEYTYICSFKKKDALECLAADKKKFIKFISESIERFDKENSWR